MKKILLLLSLYAIAVSSCKKSGDDNTPTNTDTFLPSTVGTSWTYNRTTTTGTTTITYTVTNRDTSIAGRTYKIMDGSDNSKQYYAKSGVDYYTTQSLSGNTVELNFLKDDKNVNDTWTTNQTINNITGIPGVTSANAIIKYTIQEKGSARTVGSQSFTNVIKVRADLSASISLLPTPLSLGYAEFYFAKNIGIIEDNIQITNALIGLSITQSDKIQSYTIK